jgi:two-component system, LytTR family, sensor kinase
MKNKLYWKCQFGAWGIIFFYECITNYLSGRLLAEEMPLSFLSAVLGILFTHFYRLIVLKKINWAGLSVQQLVFRMLVSSAIIGTLLSFYQCIQAVVISQDRASFHPYFFLVFFISTFSLSLNWNLIYFMLKYIKHNEKLSIEKIKIELLNKNLELANIKLNLQPHFIFNALNSIRSLISENQDKARNATTQLSNILRNSLVGDKEELVTLEKEFNLVKDYLSLESIRYEERLTVQYKIEHECLQALIPPMLLQTLVENGIKHGIALSTSGGFLSLQIAVLNTDAVQISIENSGHFFESSAPEKEGFGLSASIKRLKYLFGSKASLAIENSSMNTVLTKLVLPA